MRRYDNKAFTILELLVAMGLLVAMLAISGLVFKMAVDAHRRAEATGEVTRRLRAIVNQLDADFKGLRTDCEIVLGWVPVPVDGNGKVLASNMPPANVHHYARFDKILFYTNGNFQSYSPWPYTDSNHTPPNWTDNVTGNVARVCYSHAEDGTAASNPISQLPARRVLARSQHIYAPDARLSPMVDATNSTTILRDFTPNFINAGQYDALDPYLWTSLPRTGMVPPDPAGLKLTLLSRIFGYTLSFLNLTVNDSDYPFVTHRGTFLAPLGGLVADPTVRPVVNPHLLFGEGIGEFKIQCWYEYLSENIPAGQKPKSGRWYPEVDPNGDDKLDDSDFALLLPNSLGNGMLVALYSGGGAWQTPPGPGRALKFTFTLYDSHGVFKNGKTFTHIVYLK